MNEREDLLVGARLLLGALRIPKPLPLINLPEEILDDNIEETDTDGWRIKVGEVPALAEVYVYLDDWARLSERCFWTGFEFKDKHEFRQRIRKKFGVPTYDDDDVEYVQDTDSYRLNTSVPPSALRTPVAESYASDSLFYYGVYDERYLQPSQGTHFGWHYAALFVIDSLRSFVDEEEKFKEGQCGQVTKSERERNEGARRACLALYGYSCQICGFDFEKTYGEIGREYIHVHHIEPLALGERETRAGKDLIPVCPNCHGMLHRRREVMLPDELRELLRIHRS